MAKNKNQKTSVNKRNVVLEQLAVIYLPVEAIKPNSYNPNRQSEHDFTLLCKSISTHGFTQPIIVQRETREIVDGEHRWRACKALGFAEVPCVLTDMTVAQMRISTLRLNRARGTEVADLAVDVVKSLRDMGALDFAVDELMLDPVEVRRILEDMPTSELPDLSTDITAGQLGVFGSGLTEFDSQYAVNTSGDKTRAKEHILAEARAAEERQMSAADKGVYRLGLCYTGAEGELVARVLRHLGSEQSMPRAVYKLCAHFADRALQAGK